MAIGQTVHKQCQIVTKAKTKQKNIANSGLISAIEQRIAQQMDYLVISNVKFQ